jgi:hypothetical protein
MRQRLQADRGGSKKEDESDEESGAEQPKSLDYIRGSLNIKR